MVDRSQVHSVCGRLIDTD